MCVCVCNCLPALKHKPQSRNGSAKQDRLCVCPQHYTLRDDKQQAVYDVLLDQARAVGFEILVNQDPLGTTYFQGSLDLLIEALATTGKLWHLHTHT